MKGRQFNSAKSQVRISAPALKATHHETKLHNLSHLTGREGGPCPRSSLNASHHSKNYSTSIISQVSNAFSIESRMKLNAFQTRAGTGSAFPTCEVANGELLFEY